MTIKNMIDTELFLLQRVKAKPCFLLYCNFLCLKNENERNNICFHIFIQWICKFFPASKLD